MTKGGGCDTVQTMSIEGVTADLSKAHESASLITIHMHDGSMTEYAGVVDFPKSDGHARVRIQPYRLLSGARLVTKGRRAHLTINQIDYITVYPDKMVPSQS